MVKRATPDQALELAEDRRKAGRAQLLESNPELRREVEEYELLFDAIEASRSEGAPPEHLLHWARSWARTVSKPAPALPTRILSLLSRRRLSVPAVRSAYSATEAGLYGDDQFQLDLRVEESRDGSWRLRGQLVSLQSEQENWTIRILGPGAGARIARCDEYGEFSLGNLPRDSSLSLVAESGSCRLYLPRVGGPAGEDAR